MTFHIYTLINVIFFGYLGQEVKLYTKGIKRLKRLITLSVLATLSLVGIILFDVLSLKNIATLVYDVAVSVFIFFILYLKSVDNYKVMQRVYKRREVRKLSFAFYSVITLFLLTPFIIVAVLSITSSQKDFFVSNNNIPYLFLGIFAYLGLFFSVIMAFTSKYYAHYQTQVVEEEGENDCLENDITEHETRENDRLENTNDKHEN